jgi:hypothetical protein
LFWIEVEMNKLRIVSAVLRKEETKRPEIKRINSPRYDAWNYYF